MESLKNNLEQMRNKATKNGFELNHFSGFVLSEMGANQINFNTLDEVNHYIDFCNLSEQQMKARGYNFTTDSEIAE